MILILSSSKTKHFIFRLNRPQDAMEDAETAKDYDGNSVKIIIAKAEAYYHMGQFERALGE